MTDLDADLREALISEPLAYHRLEPPEDWADQLWNPARQAEWKTPARVTTACNSPVPTDSVWVDVRCIDGQYTNQVHYPRAKPRIRSPRISSVSVNSMVVW